MATCSHLRHAPGCAQGLVHRPALRNARRAAAGARQASRAGCQSGAAHSFCGCRLPLRTGPSRAPQQGQAGLSRGRLQITASVFGVGAPEALVVGVVALVVFGPRGLAEAVKSLGATLKTFQPTIREVLGVTQDLRNTLEEQIGLDDIRREFRGQGSVPPSWSSQGSQLRPSSSPDWDSPTGGSSEPPSLTRTAESLNGAGSSNGSVDSGSGGSSSHSPEASPSSSSPSHEGELEAMRKQSAAAAWGGQEPERRAQQSEGGSPAASPLAGLTLEDLEAELKRRKGGSKDRAAA